MYIQDHTTVATSTSTTLLWNSGFQKYYKTTTEMEYDYYDYDVNSEAVTFRKTVHVAFYVAAYLSFATLIYGIITWAVFPTSRTFQNYVYINVMLAVTLDLYTIHIQHIDISFLGYPLWLYSIYMFSTAFHCWLFVATVLIYRNIVVVFNSELPRKYLISNGFAWGVPMFWLLIMVMNLTVHKQCYKVFTLLMLIVEVLLYIRVMYFLYKGLRGRRVFRKFRNMQVATFTFFMGGVPMLLVAKASEPLESAIVNHAIGLAHLVLIILVLIINVLFILLKVNRDLWCKLLFK